MPPPTEEYSGWGRVPVYSTYHVSIPPPPAGECDVEYYVVCYHLGRAHLAMACGQAPQHEHEMEYSGGHI